MSVSARIGLFAALVLGAGCGGYVPTPLARDLDAPARMVLTERWRSGGRLIIVDETGDRLAPLLVPGHAGGAAAVDEHPAFSPDGRWIVFASTRDRDDGRRSLWVAAARPDAVPRRITTGAASDIDPTWTPAGDGIVFASDRGGASIDLYRVAMKDGAPVGAPERLTDAPTHELAPSLEGGRFVLQVIDPASGASWIAERAADGALGALTAGPSDGAPALSPDGKRLAYTAARLREDGERDLDVIVVEVDGEVDGDLLGGGGRERPGIALVGSDEGAPAWSSDGRWLFVTSIVRDDEGAPLLPSVVHLDTWRTPPRVRMLRDTAGAAPRLGAALAKVDLDQTSLLRNPDHATALRLALAELAEELAAARERAQARGRRDDAAPSTLPR